MTNNNKITVVGAGYVGMSIGVLLAQKNDVIIYDISEEKVNKINNQESTIKDSDISDFLLKELSLKATTDKVKALKSANFIIIATPTDYIEEINKFDTSSVDSIVFEALKINKDALIVIKSTLPIGHTKSLQSKFNASRIIFSPEFLREGRALKDNLYPSRIIIGSKCKEAYDFAELLKSCSLKDDVNVIHMQSTEAEAVKLFANTYLAMRVAFFNELDSFSISNELSSKDIIEGLSSDKRIGDYYNNPSFGYGGYCLPKDTKQLLSQSNNPNDNLMSAIVSSNSSRKAFIFDEIIKLKPNSIGFFRLIMKEGSDNFRSSAVQSILKKIIATNIKIYIYEPSLKKTKFLNQEIISDLNEFKNKSDLIIANRNTYELTDVLDKVFSRDIFGEN
tara:strand:- start:379 stop:1554 length:1176 start_codon:yes stop_codon:yes gene_type:complete